MHKLDKTLRKTLKEQDALEYITTKGNAVNGGAQEPLQNFFDVSFTLFWFVFLYIYAITAHYISQLERVSSFCLETEIKSSLLALSYTWNKVKPIKLRKKEVNA